ncbi:MAG: SIS domain-containing protein [Jatrophihabitans sp.]
MSFVAEEINRQPAAWLRAAELSADAEKVLPRAGERVAVVGCGTSWFIAEAYTHLREDAGHGQTDSFTASMFPLGRRYDRLLAITRSGTTTEVLRVLESQRAGSSTAITADPHTPVIAAAENTIVLDFADERSVVQTVFASTTLALLRAQLGEDVAALAAAASDALAAPLAHELLAADQITFLGQGWAHGLAREAALKMREAAQLWTEAYPAMEYRHGPIAIAQPGRVVWVLGEPVSGIVEDIRATGATAVVTGNDPLVDLVLIQRLAVARAELLGLDADRPRNLTRSVVLPG